VIVLVVAKAPVPGQVKTRLCPPATPQQAAAIAAAALLDTLDAVRATTGVTPILAYAGQLAGAERFDDIRSALAGWRLVPQRGATFADRLAHAHADAAAHAPGQPVLQIGMDTPQVRPATLAAALNRLCVADAVLGPATDGGWWALGLRDPHHAETLRAVPMSTPETGELTRAALARRGLHTAGAPRLSDVDRWDDALAVAGAVPGSRFAAAVAELTVGAAR
jgi:rSAM/selenodomain-associated transferase 1